jgi:hypothetical protein
LLAAQSNDPAEENSYKILVDKKLRAICLLEADFNWWLKLIYVRRMMSDIRRSNMIPAKQFATTGRTAIDRVLAKQLGFLIEPTLYISPQLLT